jgi:glycosyltransferase involved in cell wall biosynthesis
MNETAPLISIVMPAYNAEPYIAEAIESVLVQTLSDWELIIVNDGSNDNTVAVVEGFTDPRVKLINQENKGCYYARNVGLKKARGKYIGLLDADDWYEPFHLELTTDFMEMYTECSLVGTNYYLVDSAGHKTLGCNKDEILGRSGDGVISDYFSAAIRNRCFPITNCAVFRKEKIEELGEFDESFLMGGDHEFWTRWAMRSNFGYIDMPTCYYREDTPGSVRKNLERSIRMRLKAWKKLTSMEPRQLPCWSSYSRFRSHRIFRMVCLTIATGYFKEMKEFAAIWPASPRHCLWWMGKMLAMLPGFCHRAMHSMMWRFEFVRYRQGKPTDTEDQKKSGSS